MQRERAASQIRDPGLLQRKESGSRVCSASLHVRAGKLRALAFTGATRMPQLPDLPTLAQAGVAGYEAAGFLGIMVRTGTPPEVIARLNRDINAALKSPEMTQLIANGGLGEGGGTAEDFANFLKRDRAIWTKVIAQGGIKGEQ